MVVGIVTGLIALGEPMPQWIAVGIGVYAVFSWGSALKRRDAPAFALIVGNPALIFTVVAYGLNAFLSYTVTFWAPSYATTVLGRPLAEAGFVIGGLGAMSGFLGVTLGGLIADRLRRGNPAGRLLVVIFGAVVPSIAIAIAFTTTQPTLFYLMLFPAQAFASCALGAAGATTQDLVLPRMRGTATATFFIGTTLLGLSMGPVSRRAHFDAVGQPVDRRAVDAGRGAGDAVRRHHGLSPGARRRSQSRGAGAGGGRGHLTPPTARCLTIVGRVSSP